MNKHDMSFVVKYQNLLCSYRWSPVDPPQWSLIQKTFPCHFIVIFYKCNDGPKTPFSQYKTAKMLARYTFSRTCVKDNVNSLGYFSCNIWDCVYSAYPWYALYVFLHYYWDGMCHVDNTCFLEIQLRDKVTETLSYTHQRHHMEK